MRTVWAALIPTVGARDRWADVLALTADSAEYFELSAIRRVRKARAGELSARASPTGGV